MTIQDLEKRYAATAAGNGTDFIKKIHTASIGKETPTLQLLSFLDRIITDFIPEGRRICRAAPDLSQPDRDALTFHGKIVCAEILILHEARSSEELRSKLLLFLEYASALARSRYDLVGLALNAVSYPVAKPGIGWGTVEESLTLDIISYQMTRDIRFDRRNPVCRQFAGKGKVVCNKGVLSIFSSEVGETGARAFGVCNDKVEVVTKNSREEKLKASDQENIDALALFAATFLRTQERYEPEKRPRKQYLAGDTVDIRVKGVRDGRYVCETLDGDDPLEGTLVSEDLICGTKTDDITPYLFDGDVISGARLILSDDGVRFSVKRTYAAFAIQAAGRDERQETLLEAKVMRILPGLNRINWMTARGYGGISVLVPGENLHVGDKRVMRVENVRDTHDTIYVNLCSATGSDADSRVEFDEDGDKILADFVTPADKVQPAPAAETEDLWKDGADAIGRLSGIIANRAREESSFVRYRTLLVAEFLRRAVGDEEGLARLAPEAAYLRGVLSFAQRKPVTVPGDGFLDKERETVLRLLSEADSPEDVLIRAMVGLETGSLPARIGALLLGVRISAAFRDQVKADPEEVRRKICSLLGVQDAYREVAAVRIGKYGRTENHEVEFKASYVFRNDGKGPDLDYQGKGQVFEAVCGFLNADGGTLYLGVNDGGDPIRAGDAGLRADIAWLSSNYQGINRQRSAQLGHPVNKVVSLDTFVQFLDAEKELFFKESLLGNIIIEVTEDEDAIRLKVRPSRYEIAYLYSDKEHRDGVAYVRDGGRTVPMSDAQKRRRLMSLKKISREMDFVVTIQEAIDQHRKLIFKDYSSGNSDRVKDRFVVPVNLFYNDENVYCYDLESRSYKQFRLRRIGSIETEMENPFYPLSLKPPRKVDVFRWLDEGKKSYHIKLRMAVAAKNYLVEEYSCAENLPKEELYEEKKDVWILDTRLNGLDAVRRFYLGLADRIEILDTEDSDALKAAIAKFVAENIA